LYQHVAVSTLLTVWIEL